MKAHSRIHAADCDDAKVQLHNFREIQPRLTMQEQLAIHLLLLGIHLFPRQRRGNRRCAQTGHQDELGSLEPFGQLWCVLPYHSLVKDVPASGRCSQACQADSVRILKADDDVNADADVTVDATPPPAQTGSSKVDIVNAGGAGRRSPGIGAGGVTGSPGAKIDASTSSLS